MNKEQFDRLFDLSGRVAVVSGAAQGIGRAISLGLAEVGADVAPVDLNEAEIGRAHV